jgi:hypothetical protein
MSVSASTSPINLVMLKTYSTKVSLKIPLKTAPRQSLETLCLIEHFFLCHEVEHFFLDVIAFSDTSIEVKVRGLIGPPV